METAQSLALSHENRYFYDIEKIKEAFLDKRNETKETMPEFRKITEDDMDLIWSYLKTEKGRTTDFSYGGVLMWVDYFKYEFSIFKDTLFIKGVVENDIDKPAFSLPIGKLPLSESVELLKNYCKEKDIELEFSAIPQHALEEMEKLNPVKIEELTDWGDYLYDAEMLSTAKGKKMSKKRNHINQFMNHYADWRLETMNEDNADDALNFMDIFDLEGDMTEMAIIERGLSRELIQKIKEGDKNLKGAILYVGNDVAAYTIGDLKGDTLFIHVEKATRNFSGSYETINHLFAKSICESNPDIKYINREDDAGDEGLRKAKLSYHPIEVLKKYNIIF